MKNVWRRATNGQRTTRVTVFHVMVVTPEEWNVC
jgi:hypothetical protein